jgi:general secretion pathway protein A
MTLGFYKLREQPFGSIPDPRFLFVSTAHRQAVAVILLALQKGTGVVSLVSQAGLGKTTLLYHIFKTLQQNITTVYIFQAPQTPIDLLRAVLADLGVRDIDETPTEMLATLEQLLTEQVEQQKRLVVIIDEAQNLSPSVLELVQMLANTANDRGKLLQFVLCGQSQLTQTPSPSTSTQLSYRAPMVARLDPLNTADTALYIDHRLRVAGYEEQEPLFTAEASALIARYSEGVPRKINNLCFSAVSQGYKAKRPRVEADIVRAVIADLGLDRTLHEPMAVPLVASRPAAPELSARSISPSPAPVLPAQVISPPPFMPIPAPAPLVAVAVADSILPAVFTSVVIREEVQTPRSLERVSAATPAPIADRAAPAAPYRPRFVGRKKAPATAWRLVPAVGLAAAVLLTAAVSLVTLDHHTPPALRKSATTPLVSSIPQTAPAPPAVRKTAPPVLRVHQPSASPDLKGMNLNAAVRALSGRSLMTLCKENFGQCNSKQLQEMHRVNLRLSKVPPHGVPNHRSPAAPRVTKAEAERPPFDAPN